MICLNMIVKNEAHVIERCLASVLPLIDAWVIVDTGSTDDTPAIIERMMQDKPGQLHHRPWVNFGHNRTEALQLAQEHVHGEGHVLIMDADETLLAQPGFAWPSLSADLYSIPTRSIDVEYARNVLVRAALPWRWEGVLHEYLHADQTFTRDRIAGLHIQRYFDGARSADPQKYAKDAALLEKALRTEPGNTRYAFYLAQSLRDSGQAERALAMYEKRAEMGGWDEEVWYAQYQAARLADGLGHSSDQVTARYLQAYRARPTRAEPLVHLARHLRLRGDHVMAYTYILAAMSIPEPPDLLFIEKPCYGWLRADEFAVACSWTGRLEQARAGFAELINAGDLPECERARTQANLEFCMRGAE